MARRCGWCGQQPIGYAQIGDVWYCHSDNPGPTCYELAQFDAEVQANDRRLFEAIARTARNDGPGGE